MGNVISAPLNIWCHFTDATIFLVTKPLVAVPSALGGMLLAGYAARGIDPVVSLVAAGLGGTAGLLLSSYFFGGGGACKVAETVTTGVDNVLAGKDVNDGVKDAGAVRSIVGGVVDQYNPTNCNYSHWWNYMNPAKDAFCVVKDQVVNRIANNNK